MRFCHLSSHLRSECECGCGGCECVHEWDDYVAPDMPVFGTVPGAHNDTAEYRYHMDFDKGMYAYEKARKEGLQPPTSDLKGVQKAQEQVRSHEKALKKLKKYGSDVSNLERAAGVDA